MKFFIDTANLDQIKEAQDMGILDGVTTNPSLMAKEGITGEKNIIDHYLKICDIVDGDVSAEVISVNYDGIIKEGEILASLHKQIVIKVPMIEEGVKAIRYFSDKGLKTNCTLIFSSGQALLAAKAGAEYVSPFIGRLDDLNLEGIDLISDIKLIYSIILIYQLYLLIILYLYYQFSNFININSIIVNYSFFILYQIRMLLTIA